MKIKDAHLSGWLSYSSRINLLHYWKVRTCRNDDSVLSAHLSDMKEKILSNFRTGKAKVTEPVD